MSTQPPGNYSTNPYNFGAIPCSAQQRSSVCVIPVPYDSTSSSKLAARRGPEAILRASRNLELFDSELGVETSKVGIQTLDEVEPNVNSPFENSQVVEAVVTDTLDANKLPVVIGGDHSLTIGAVRAALGKYPDVGFVMLDESHVSVHTYADEGKMAIDVFTCGDTNAQGIAEQLKADLKPEKLQEQSLERF